MRSSRFLSPAEREMVQAARYYESKVPTLGAEFLLEIEAAVRSIETHPDAAPNVRGDIRRRLVRRFPYAVLYRAAPEGILILAVMHQRRRPDYWHGRE